MSEPTVALYTIGQTPRPDLTEDFTARFGSVHFEVAGALDQLRTEELPSWGGDGYPLETRMRDGRRVVVDASFLEERLQLIISETDERVAAHVVLCAGPFPRLDASRPILQPFDIAVEELSQRGLRSLDVVVPFAAQVEPSARKWTGAGFECRVQALLDEPPEGADGVRTHRGDRGEMPLPAGLRAGGGDSSADALVIDYVGFPPDFIDRVASETDLKVFELGHLTMDALESTLSRP